MLSSLPVPHHPDLYTLQPVALKPIRPSPYHFIQHQILLTSSASLVTQPGPYFEHCFAFGEVSVLKNRAAVSPNYTSPVDLSFSTSISYLFHLCTIHQPFSVLQAPDSLASTSNSFGELLVYIVDKLKAKEKRKRKTALRHFDFPYVGEASSDRCPESHG